METSTTIGEIGKAIAAAQAEMEPASKNSTNPFFKSKYADLAEVSKAIKPLAKHGVAYVQDVSRTEHGVSVQVMLIHTSGEWIKFSPLELPVEKDTAQGVVSAVTYGRRGTLAANTGAVADELDDDGNAASGNTSERQPRQQHKPAKANGEPPQITCSERAAKGKELLRKCIEEKNHATAVKTLDAIPAAVKDGNLTVDDGEELRLFFTNQLVNRIRPAPTKEILEGWKEFGTHFSKSLPPMLCQRIDEAWLARKGELLAETATV